MLAKLNFRRIVEHQNYVTERKAMEKGLVVAKNILHPLKYKLVAFFYSDNMQNSIEYADHHAVLSRWLETLLYKNIKNSCYVPYNLWESLSCFPHILQYRILRHSIPLSSLHPNLGGVGTNPFSELESRWHDSHPEGRDLHLVRHTYWSINGLGLPDRLCALAAQYSRDLTGDNQ